MPSFSGFTSPSPSLAESSLTFLKAEDSLAFLKAEGALDLLQVESQLALLSMRTGCRVGLGADWGVDLELKQGVDSSEGLAYAMCQQ